MCKKVGVAILLLLSALSFTNAQDECELTLIRATEEFSAGHLYGIPAILSDCLNKSQNDEWQQRAYLLLTETYLLLEDPIGAENSFLKVLYANPEYVADANRDPIDLVYLSKKFTATPVFAFHGMLGPNTSLVRVIHDVTVGGESQTKQAYKLSLGWQFGAGFDYNFNSHITVSAGLNYVFTAFKHRTTNLFGANKDIVEFLDRQTWAVVPLTIGYGDDKGKFRPYAYAGYSANYLLRDRGILNVFNRDARPQAIGLENEAEELSSADNETPNLNLRDHRMKFNASFLLGGGIKYKYNLNYFFVDVRYSLGIRNVANSKNRYDSYSEGLPYPYVDDDFRLDNVAVSVGYVYPFYKPRKLKKARTKSVLRGFKSERHATDQP